MNDPPRLPVGAFADEEWLDRQVDHLTLDDQGREYFRGRCVAYLRYLEKEARVNMHRYYGLRIPAIVLAAIVPALVAANLGPGWRVVTVAFGVTVAAATAIEHFVSAGEKWRHYRQAAEIMKSEAWLFVELADRYARCATHQEALPKFTSAVETMVRGDVRDYVTRIVAPESRDDPKTQAKSPE